MKRIVIFLFIICASCPIWGQSEIDINAEKAAIRAVIDMQNPTSQSSTYEESSQAWAHSPQIQRISGGVRQLGWDEISGHYKQAALNRKENPWSLDRKKTNMQYSVFGNVVWASWEQYTKYSSPKTGLTGEDWSWTVRLLEKQKGQWKIVGQIARPRRPEPDNLAALQSPINSLGNRLLAMSKAKEAIKVFKLSTEFFPESSWAYDSLGEAYMAAGNTELAIQNLTKSLQLNPKNAETKKMLDELAKK